MSVSLPSHLCLMFLPSHAYLIPSIICEFSFYLVFPLSFLICTYRYIYIYMFCFCFPPSPFFLSPPFCRCIYLPTTLSFFRAIGLQFGLVWSTGHGVGVLQCGALLGSLRSDVSCYVSLRLGRVPVCILEKRFARPWGNCSAKRLPGSNRPSLWGSMLQTLTLESSQNASLVLNGLLWLACDR